MKKKMFMKMKEKMFTKMKKKQFMKIKKLKNILNQKLYFYYNNIQIIQKTGIMMKNCSNKKKLIT